MMDGLNGLDEGDGHVGRVRDEHAVELHPLVILLVAEQAIDVDELIVRRCCGQDRLRAESGVAIAAGIPVTKNIDAVAVECV